MRHPTDGTLRRLLDEPEGVADADREHVAGCPECRSELAAAHEDAGIVTAAMAVEVPVDVDAAWQRLSGALAGGERWSAAASVPAARRRRGLRSPRVALVGAVALLTGASVAAAADWLQIFRTEQVAPVTVTQPELVRLPDLTAYGDVEVLDEVDIREVADAETAAQQSGLPVPQVRELPRGVTGEPTFRIGSRVRAQFTFSAEEAARTAAAAGEPLPPPPAGLDGSRFRLVAGPGIAAVWPEARGLPALVVARAVAPTADSTGVPFTTARDYLLSLPGLPDEVADQLRGFSADGTTLPLPLPADEVTSRAAEVGGAPATVVTSRDGALAGVVWVQDGMVTAVLGSLSADEVLKVARELRWSR